MPKSSTWRKRRGGSPNAKTAKKRCPKGTKMNKHTKECEPVAFVPYKDLPREYVMQVKEIFDNIRNRRSKEMDLDGIHIEGEEFIGTPEKPITLQNVLLPRSTIKHSKFQNVNLGNTVFDGATLEHVEFSELADKMQNLRFIRAKLNQVTFSGLKSVFICEFNGAKMKNVVFDNLPEDVKKEIEDSLSKSQKKGVSFRNVYSTSEEEEEDEYSRSASQRLDNTYSPMEGTLWSSDTKSSIQGCPSHGIIPSSDCEHYKKQSLVFHPDKNPNCRDSATRKMKRLNSYCNA